MITYVKVLTVHVRWGEIKYDLIPVCPLVHTGLKLHLNVRCLV